MSETRGARGIAVAIVGIGCRFPGGVSDADSFWRLLSEGRDAITEIPSDRMDVRRYFDPKPSTPGRMTNRWGGFLDRIDEFDADFFGISPREAECLDPQQRLLLETAWEAFEDAGQDIRKLEGSTTGVFIGQWTSDFEARLFADAETLNFYATEGSGRYASSGRVSYVFGLRGPSLTIDTACSSSLAAVHLAVQSIRSGESHAALAGGANIILQPQINIAYSQSRMMAEDGRCKFGDASGDGYVRSEGVAVVFLKPLDRALADGDKIYAVIRGSAINNDGRSSGSLGRPSRVGQEEVLRAAYLDAGVAASGVQYIEAHGTGTRAGDPIELNALATVVGKALEPDQHIYVGSVKTNIGHTEAAAGMAGLIKTALALRHAAIPPSLHYDVPNPTIAWADLPFTIPRKLMKWPNSNGPRRAGITSFGIAGANAHVVLEEAPTQAALPVARQSSPPALVLPLSAGTPAALRVLADRVADLLESNIDLTLRDLCWAAAVRRTALEHRAAFVASDSAALVEMLRSYAEGGAAAAQGTARGGEVPKVCLVCPGQGAQWVGMARQLMTHAPEFLGALERCDEAIRPFVDWSIIAQLNAEPGRPEYQLDRIDVIQPVLVAIAIAYASLLRSFGVEPAAVVGHSMGEVAAANIAGVLSLKQAMRVICGRSALLQRISGRGAMALVELSTKDAAVRLFGWEDRVSVAVSNSPRSSVISGDPDAVCEIMKQLERDGVFCRSVNVDVASHSPQTQPLSDELVTQLDNLSAGNARIPLWSTVLGRRAEGTEFDAAYWGRNLRDTVHFTDATRDLLNKGITTFVELGPHPVLLHSVDQTAQSRGSQVCLAACGRRDEGDFASLLVAVGQLWAVGCPIDWSQILPKAQRFLSLPHYPWQRERHWAAAAAMASSSSKRTVRTAADEELNGLLFRLEWKPRDLDPKRGPERALNSTWLVVFADPEDRLTVANALESVGAKSSSASVNELEKAIEGFAQERAPNLGLAVCVPDGPDAPYLPVRVLQAVLKQKWSASPKIWFVTRGAQLPSSNGSGGSIDQAALWGTARVIAQEHPEFWGGLIEFERRSEHRSNGDRFVREMMSAAGEDQIAYQDDRRYVLRLVPSPVNRQPETFSPRPDATYLVTGGFGDIGLQIARMLAARGARRLILMGRTPLPPREEWGRIETNSMIGQRVAAVRALESEGVAVHIAAVDVSDQSQVEKYLNRYAVERWPPIRGVFHAAGSLNDQLASSLSKADFDALLESKLRGAQHLDRVLPDLDMFVMVSSICAFIAQPGQANYAAANAGLDALAHDRRRRGLASLSIGWGVWAETGLVKGETGERNVAELSRQGIGSLSMERAVSIFASLCAHQEPYVAVIPIDWAKFQRARSTRNSLMFSEVLQGSDKSHRDVSKFKDQFAASTSAERRKLLDGVVKSAVGAVLKVAPTRIDPRKPIGSMGLTSLMAMELRNRLEAELDRPLSATLVWNYPTVEALVAYLLDSTPGRAAEADVGDLAAPESIQAVIDLSDEQVLAALRAGESAGGIRQ
jgi:acyl transferase domain-containing protein/acyl carrier protein